MFSSTTKQNLKGLVISLYMIRTSFVKKSVGVRHIWIKVTLVNPSVCWSLSMAVTSALPENFLLRAHVVLNLYTENHHYISSQFKHTSKNFEGGLPKHILEILEKNTVFWKKGVEIWAFDGIPLFLYLLNRCSKCCPRSSSSLWSPSSLSSLQSASLQVKLFFIVAIVQNWFLGKTMIYTVKKGY